MKYTNYFYSKLALILAILSLMFFLPVKIYAVDVFEDLFNGTSYTDSWIERIIMGAGSEFWFLNDGRLISDVGPGVSSQLYVKNSFDKCDYVIESSAIGVDGLDMSFIFRIAEDYSHYYM
jgi:hypothetical protein